MHENGRGKEKELQTVDADNAECVKNDDKAEPVKLAKSPNVGGGGGLGDYACSDDDNNDDEPAKPTKATPAPAASTASNMDMHAVSDAGKGSEAAWKAAERG